jgi:hypothetical protein
MVPTEAAAYLAGLIDGEGHISYRRNYAVRVANTDRDIIDATIASCDALGLRYRIQDIKPRPEKNKQGGWDVYITGKDQLERIRDVVPIQSTRKRGALDTAIAAYKQLPRPPREWVEQKYVHEGLSLQEVAEAWGAKNSVSAWCWMEFYDIPRRGKGTGRTKYPRPEREWLQERVREGLTLKQIGDQVDAPLAAVWRWCQHYNIDRTAIAEA